MSIYLSQSIRQFFPFTPTHPQQNIHLTVKPLQPNPRAGYWGIMIIRHDSCSGHFQSCEGMGTNDHLYLGSVYHAAGTGTLLKQTQQLPHKAQVSRLQGLSLSHTTLPSPRSTGQEVCQVQQESLSIRVCLWQGACHQEWLARWRD